MNFRTTFRAATWAGICVAAALASTTAQTPAQAAERFITVASTTSTRNSGLYESILPAFAKASGIDVRIVAVGTGQAIKLARNGDADVLFVHHKPSEEKFVADGFGIKRHDVMYNDFVIVGPKSDPAKIGGGSDAGVALLKISKSGASFASRGDDSGTHKKELGLWKIAGITPGKASGSWYRETGSGMGATLNTASAMNAYALTDRGTWLKFANKGDLKVLIEGDKRLFNPYGVIVVNPAKHPHVKKADAQTFVDWLVSTEGQAAIGAYRIKGKQAFFPNAQKSEGS
ncbi:MAG: extracellular solute-binding protein [Rhodospirillaceae bacterium]|nr:extracellular solute-binding protein [Rhodospirillaceae bacterium]